MGRRRALLVATDTYDDATFRRLLAPRNDAAALAAVLADEAIGDYKELSVLNNASVQQTLRAVDDLLTEARTDDQVLLYFSGHGIKTDEGELYLPSRESLHNRLASTAVRALWIRERMEISRSSRIMVWLDCCYAGAFPPGALPRSGADVDASAQLGGRGCAVMTSSTSLQYAYETTDGGSSAVTGAASPSVFTGILVDGLRTGDADRDGDGQIDADELYDYVCARMQETSFRQTPTLQSRVEGKLYVATSVRGPTGGADVRQYLSMIEALTASARARGTGQAQRVRAPLAWLAEHENPRVAEAARSGLAATMLTPTAATRAGPPEPAPASLPQPAGAPVVAAGRRGAATSLIRKLLRATEASGPRADERLDLAAANLASAVREQWTAEAGSRWGDRSQALAVRWSTTGRPVAAPPAAVLGTVIPGRPIRLRLHGDFHEIAEKYRKLPMRQLVILGRPGSGKTALATRMLLGLLHDAEPDASVPVLLPVSSWNPYQQPAYEWMAQRLTEGYPALANKGEFGDGAAARLLAAHRVIPVLDGLDEMPASWQHAALEALDQAVTDQGPLVLTCRSDEYEAAVAARAAATDRSFLSHAAVVELETPTVIDIIGYLEAGRSPADRRWQPVTEHLRLQPDSPLAQALSTPLMADLATSAYAGPATDPAELTDAGRFTERAALERHLLDAFIMTRLDRPPARRYSTAQAQKWLGFLSWHLDRLATRELEWWQLIRAVPKWLISTLVAAVPIVSVVLPFSLWIAVAPSIEYRGAWIATTCGFGVALATLLGRHAAAAARPRDQTGGGPLRPLLRGVRDDLSAIIITVSTTLALALAVLYLFARTTALYISFNVVTRIRQLPHDGTALSALVFVADMALVVIVIPNLLGAAYGGMPRRGTPSIARLGSSLGNGVLTGIVVTVPTVILGILVSRTWLLVALAVASLLGLVVGLGRWLATPVDEQAAGGSPLSVLRGDRRTVLISAAVTMAGVALIVAVVIALIIVVTESVPLTAPRLAELLLTGLITGLVAGLAMALVVVLGSGSAWLSYSAARSWLALQGKLPWRLMGFLSDAHDRGMLRQVGPAYQFGHALLQDRLAQDHAPAAAVPASATPAGLRPESGARHFVLPRRVLLAVLPVVPLAALACAVIFTYAAIPSPLRTIDIGNTASALAMSPSGDELAAAFYNDEYANGPAAGDVDIRSLSTDRVVHAHYQVNAKSGEPSVNALTFSADSKMLIAALDNGVIIWWDAASGREVSQVRVPVLATLAAANNAYEAEGFSADGQFLGAAAQVGDTGNNYTVVVEKLAGPTGMPSQIADSTFLVSGGFGINYPALAISSDGTTETVAVAMYGGILLGRFGDSRSPGPSIYPPTRELPGHPSEDPNFYDVALSPDGTALAAEDDDGVYAWDVHSGRVEQLAVPFDTYFGPIAYSSDGRSLAVSDDDGNSNDVEIWPANVS